MSPGGLPANGVGYVGIELSAPEKTGRICFPKTKANYVYSKQLSNVI